MLEYDRNSTYGRPDPGLVEQWKRKQSPREIGMVEAKIGPLLQSRGYAPSGHPPRAVRGLARMRLKLASRLSVFRTRLRRFGWRDTLIELVARRLGLTEMARAARRRIDGKTQQYLK
ncbi:MAG: hypothetical protein AAF908_01290 [Pseudomonadota bacterium]